MVLFFYLQDVIKKILLIKITFIIINTNISFCVLKKEIELNKTFDKYLLTYALFGLKIFTNV